MADLISRCILVDANDRPAAVDVVTVLELYAQGGPGSPAGLAQQRSEAAVAQLGRVRLRAEKREEQLQRLPHLASIPRDTSIGVPVLGRASCPARLRAAGNANSWSGTASNSLGAEERMQTLSSMDARRAIRQERNQSALFESNLQAFPGAVTMPTGFASGSPLSVGLPNPFAGSLGLASSLSSDLGGQVSSVGTVQE